MRRSSREPAWRDLKVGLVGLAGIFVVVLLVVKVDRNKGIFTKDSRIQAEMRDLRGLRMGSPVQYSGVEVGSVTNIDFMSNGKVLLTMLIRQKVRPFVKTSSTLSVEALGVLGDKYALISTGNAEDPPLAEGELIQVKRSSSIFDALSGTSKAVGGITDVVEQLNQVLEKINEAEGTVGKLINDPKVFDDMQGLFERLNQAVREKSTLGKLANDPKLYDSMNKAASNLSIFLDNVKRSDSTLGRLTQDQELYNKIDRLSDQVIVLSEELTELVKDIKKRPKRYFKVSVF